MNIFSGKFQRSLACWRAFRENWLTGWSLINFWLNLYLEAEVALHFNFSG